MLIALMLVALAGNPPASVAAQPAAQPDADKTRERTELMIRGAVARARTQPNCGVKTENAGQPGGVDLRPGRTAVVKDLTYRHGENPGLGYFHPVIRLGADGCMQATPIEYIEPPLNVTPEGAPQNRR